MFKRTRMSHAVVLALGGWAASASAPVAAQEAQRIEIVGSNISRINSEGPSPVTVIKKEEIQRSGATTVNDLLKSVGVALNSFDDQNNNSSAPSTSAINLRGAGVDSTLVLLNGRRISPHGFSQGLTSGDVQFVDLNTIPIGAIEQIQILKDGASAIYGSDAIAGVINFVTRKDYQGVEARGMVGGTADGGGGERGVSVTGGWGDFEKDGFNLLASLDFHHKSAITYKQRAITSTADLRKYGGPDRRSSGSPYMNFLDPDTGNFYTPSCPPANLRGGICRWEPSDTEGLQPDSDRASMMLVFNKKLSNDLKFFSEALWTRNTSKYDIRGAFLDFGFTQNAADQAAKYRGLDLAATQALSDAVWAKTFADFKAAYPTVDTGAATRLIGWGRLTELGPRNYKMESTTSRYLAGLSGTTGNWDWQTAFGQSKNRAVQTNSKDEINADAFVSGYLNGSIDFIHPKDPAGFAAVSYSGLRSSEYTVTFFDAKVTGEIAKLPAGPLALATGIEWRQEELFDTSDALTLANLSLGGGAASAKGNRSAYAMFAEVNIPVTKQIEMQAAVRFDKFSDFGETINPKLAVKYQPLGSLALRASYSESFKAPSLYQLFKNVASPDYQELIDTPRCAVTNAPIDCDPILRPVRADGAAGAGGLQPEKGTAFNLGFVWQPTKNSSVSVDTWRLRKTGAIQTQDAQDILNNNLTQYIKRQPNGQIEYVIASYRNIGALKVEGTDIDGSVNFGLGGAGMLTLGATLTYLSKYDEIDGGSVTSRPGSFSYPRLRSQLRANWQFGDFSTTLTQNRRSSFADDSPFEGRKVSALATYDLQIGYSGIKDTDVRVGARNIANKMPPISFSSYVPFDQNNDSAKGRFVYLSVAHRFK